VEAASDSEDRERVPHELQPPDTQPLPRSHACTKELAPTFGESDLSGLVEREGPAAERHAAGEAQLTRMLFCKSSAQYRI
jgi:hypothetical protein